MTNNRPIGIFDSGIGGLTVFKEVSKLLPEENIIYLGDTARVPYGIRSPETVIRYSFECTEFLLRQGIKMLVIACNTASAISLTEIKERVSIPVIAVIEPGARAAASSTKNGKVGIIGTEATIRSNAYLKAISDVNPDIEVFGLPCPLFVPLVEEGWTEGIVARLVVEKYLKDMIDRRIDTLVLGCTHYPLLKDIIQDVMGDVCLIDSAVETAKAVRDVIECQMSSPPRFAERGRGVKCQVSKNNRLGTRKFYVTDSPEKFVTVGERFLQSKIEDIEKIKL